MGVEGVGWEASGGRCCRCVWIIERVGCVGAVLCGLWVVSVMCDMVCAVAYAAGCLLCFSRGGMVECAMGGWVGTSTAVE